MEKAKVKILNEYNTNKLKYSHLCETTSKVIKELLELNDIKYYTVTSRLKEINSLSEKIDSKGKRYKKLGDITDISGIRIITYYSDDIDKIADIIKNQFEIDYENSIDKRTLLEPDRFGYLSLHFVAKYDNNRLSLLEYSQFKNMKFEIQIRSILQHTWAEIEHDIGYKSIIEIPRDIRRQFSQVAGLLELADKEFSEIRERINSYRDELDIKMKEKSTEHEDILLDSVSLMAFLNNNSDIKELNSEIAKYIGATESRNNEFLLGSTLFHLKYLNVLSVNKLEEKVKNNKELALHIAKYYFKDEARKSIDISIGLFYICYAEIVKTNSIEKITDYFEDNSIVDEDNPYITSNELAKDLFNIYKKYNEQ